MMRFLRQMAMMIGVMALFLADAACGQTLTLSEALPLRAGPGMQYRLLKTAPAGAVLLPEPGGSKWTRIDYDGHSYYTDTQQLNAASGVAASAETLPTDPTCDYSYPYSGSNVFFDRPLATLRHSDPLGALFGYHRRNPC
jgi:uncharacterized protein YraI